MHNFFILSLDKKIFKAEDKIKKFLIFCFSFLYVFKQTHLNNDLIEFSLVITTALLLIININRFVLFIRQNSHILLLFGWSCLLALVLFSKIDGWLVSVLKIILLINLYVVDKDNNFAAMKYMACGFTIAIILIFFMNVFNLIESSIFDNGVWKKNSFGFFNPNIGPFFIASIAYSCIFINIRLIFPILLVSLLLAIYYQFFSRAELLTIILISILYLISYCNKCLRIFSGALNILFLVYALAFFIVYFGFYKNYFYIFDLVNYLSSNRIKLIFNLPFFISFDGPIFYIEYSDGILYEFLALLGPPFLVIILYKSRQIIIKSMNLVQIISLSVFTVLGIFEGLINKITSFGVGLFHIIFMLNNIQIFHEKKIFNLNYKQLNMFLIRVFSIFGLCILIYIWNAKVYKFDIELTNKTSYQALIGTKFANNNCAKLKISYIDSVNNLNPHISVIANNKNLIDHCVNDIETLIKKYFDDENRSLTFHRLNISVSELKKENSIRYFLAVLILLFGIIYTRKLVS